MLRDEFSEICGTRVGSGEVAGVGPANTAGASDRPRLLDLYCGAGGASMGYHRAGFEVYGVDIDPQPNYPFAFIQADALAFLEFPLIGFDAIHASPPCQRFSNMTNCRPGLAQEYDDFISATREGLRRTGLPYVIENVPGSPLINPVILCGQQFGLELYRHRLFEANFAMMNLDHRQHEMPASKAGHWKPGTVMSVAGHVSPIAKAREVMGIDWTTREELAEAIPPAYTEYIGIYLHAAVWDRQQPERVAV
jgi:DNA (cytosine-5)-methyltransferase 1